MVHINLLHLHCKISGTLQLKDEVGLLRKVTVKLAHKGSKQISLHSY